MEHDLVRAFAALAHPQRLEVVRLLVDHHPVPVAAGDIGTLLGLKPSTLSGYLSQLTEAGLIAQRRSGTSLLYAVSFAQVERMNTAMIGGLCQGRGLPDMGMPGRRVRNIVFVGRGNSGPTLIAEAVVRARAGAWYEVFSAGQDPATAPDAGVIAALIDGGYDADPLYAKSVAALTGPDAPRMDVVITFGRPVTAHPQPGTTQFGGCPMQARWVIPAHNDPHALVNHIAARVEPFAALDPAITPRAGLQAVLDAASQAVAVGRVG